MRAIRLSKSKMLSGLQCPKRLYLEIHHRELGEKIDETDPWIAAGHQIGQLARDLHSKGTLIDTGADIAAALEATRRAISAGSKVLFEATFASDGLLVRHDLLFLDRGRIKLVEVKSATKVKEHHLSDVAIQRWVLERAGLKPRSVKLACVDTGFVYRGGGDYRGLLKEIDVEKDTRPFVKEVPGWVRSFRKILAGPLPKIEMGEQCDDPVPCPFKDHCAKTTKLPAYPVMILPNREGKKLARELLAEGIRDLRKVPRSRVQGSSLERIWRVTKSGKTELDPAVREQVGSLPYPRYYLDFETIQFAVPIWEQTRPYEQLPFQWSCHVERARGRLEHRQFLDTTGNAPMRSFAETLIAALAGPGPVLVYGSFESGILAGLAKRFPDLARKLEGIRGRLVDLLSMARKHYYHREMRGTWSLKWVLPTLAPELDYGKLQIRDGTMAQQAYLKAIASGTANTTRNRLRSALLDYCARDTLALVKLARFFRRA